MPPRPPRPPMKKGNSLPGEEYGDTTKINVSLRIVHVVPPPCCPPIWTNNGDKNKRGGKNVAISNGISKAHAVKTYVKAPSQLSKNNNRQPHSPKVARKCRRPEF